VPGWQLPWPDPTSTVTSTVDRFYLRELLTCPCGGLMLPTIRIELPPLSWRLLIMV
jgi:hypothetical protein